MLTSDFSWLDPVLFRLEHSRGDPLEGALARRLRSLVVSSRQSSTLNQYKHVWLKFQRWCAARQPPRCPLPASHDTVALYMVFLFEHCVEKDHGYGGIKTASAAIFCVHDLAGLTDPPTKHPLCKLVRESCKRVLGMKVKNRKEPFTAQLMVDLVLTFAREQPTPARVTIITLLILCFAAGLRFDDAVKLQWRDVTFYPGYFTVFLKERKNDVYREGDIVPVADGTTVACPRTWMKALRHVSGGGADGDQFLFRGFDGNGAESRRYDVPMREEQLSYSQAHYHAIKHLSKVMGLSYDETAELYGLHSGRSGCATGAVKGGIVDRDLLCIQVGWRDPRCANRYIQLSHEQRLTVSRALGL